jgi:hypothetical protein
LRSRAGADAGKRARHSSNEECPLWVKSGHCGAAVRCPLYPQKQTLELSRVMSALCQKRTLEIFDGLSCTRPLSPLELDASGPSGVLTLAEISLPPESDCAGPGFLVARRAARRHGLPRPAEVAPPAAVAAAVDADARQSGDDARR